MRHVVILAGGSGTRFWPLSRKNRPKQFLPLGGSQSLLRATYERVVALTAPECVWVVTASQHARRVQAELPEIPRGNVLGEPEARNTGPAILLATQIIHARDPEAALVVVPADSWVPRAAPYRQALKQALRVAERHHRLVLVGVQPTRPEIGYGYIQAGEALSPGSAQAVRQFVEKPSAARARRYLRDGYLWNCGIFAWRAEVFLTIAATTMPEVHKALAPLHIKRPGVAAIRRAYARTPSISVDYGVLERTRETAVVAAAFPWDDLGSWPALERLGRDGTFQHGTVVAEDSPGLVAWSEGGVIAVLGIPDAVVVHTADATLVMRKDLAQDVRKIVAALERNPRTRTLIEE